MTVKQIEKILETYDGIYQAEISAEKTGIKIVFTER